MRNMKSIYLAIIVFILSLIPSMAMAATAVHFGLMTPFQNDGTKWFSVVQPIAKYLWFSLFAIEIAWFGAKRVLFKVDIHSLIPALVKTLLFAGFGLAFIIHGANWFPDIVNSFVDVGQKAAGIGPITPGTILSDGMNVAANLIDSTSKIDNNMAGLIHPGVIGDLIGNPGFLMIIGLFAILIVLAFVIVAAEFIAIQVLMFIMFGVGVIMLGFSAFRPVASFAEKYFSAAISIGARMMVLYVIVGIGMGLAATWPAEVTASPTFSTLLMVLAQASVFGYLAVRIPSLAAGLLQGALNTGGGEMLATAVGAGMALAGGAAVAGEAVRGAANPVIAAARAGEAMGETGGTFMGTAARAPSAAGGSGAGGAGFGASSPHMGSAASSSTASGPKPWTGSGVNGGRSRAQPEPPKNTYPKFTGPQPPVPGWSESGSGSIPPGGGQKPATPPQRRGGAEGITALHHATSGVNSAVDKTPTQGISPKFDASRDE